MEDFLPYLCVERIHHYLTYNGPKINPSIRRDIESIGKTLPLNVKNELLLATYCIKQFIDK